MPRQQQPKRTPPLKLYWCETGDHDEDWFVVARNPKQAAQLHEDEHDYEPGEVLVTRICTLPPALQQRKDELLGRASDATLVACGARLLNGTLEGGVFSNVFDSRVVVIAGDLYKEGNCLANEARRQDAHLQN